MDLDVKSFMTGEPISIEPESSALAALDLMIDHAIRHLPVLDGAKRICGVLSFDDLRAALPIPVSLKVPPSAESRDSAREISVGEVMTYSPVTLAYDAPLEEAVSRMLEGRIGCLPIVDEGGRLDGILTETDLLQALATVLWSIPRHEEQSQSAELIASLEKERAHLVEQLRGYERVEQDLTEMRHETPLDRAEEGQSVEEGMLTEQLAELASRRLRAIEHALDRAGRGQLGVCERCGEEIPERRLRALPGSTLCIRCGRALEQAR